jgi:hypothetical protein
MTRAHLVASDDSEVAVVVDVMEQSGRLLYAWEKEVFSEASDRTRRWQE